jgi:hypothetical protein
MDQPRIEATEIPEAEVPGGKVPAGEGFDKYVCPLRKVSEGSSVFPAVQVEADIPFVRIVVGMAKGVFVFRREAA